MGEPVEATDADNNGLTYFLSGADATSFDISASSGQLRTRAALDHETKSTYLVNVTATDGSGGVGEVTVTIALNNLQEPGTLRLSALQAELGRELTAAVDDPDGIIGIIVGAWSWQRSTDQVSWAAIDAATSASYTPVADDVGAHLRVTASYTDRAGGGQSAEAATASRVQEPRGRRTPVFSEGASTTRRTTKTAPPGVNIGAPVAATDGDNDRLSYSLGVADAALFDIVESFGQLRTRADLNSEDRDSYTVTVSVSDGKDDQGGPDPAVDATIEVTITFGASPPVIIIGPIGGGGGPSGPSPSEVDFEWTVKHDIEALDAGNDTPTGMWSDGTTFWLVDNPDGPGDAVYA